MTRLRRVCLYMLVLLAVGFARRHSPGLKAGGPLRPSQATVSGDNIVALAAYNAIHVAQTGETNLGAYLPFFALDGPNTTLFVQNTTGLGTAVTVRFFNGDGTVAATSNDVIGPHAVRIYDQSTVPQLGLGFNGSAVVESDRPVATVVSWEQHLPAGDSLSSYSGIAAGAARVVVPTVMRNNYGWNSALVVQNAGHVEATVLAVFEPSTGIGNYLSRQAIVPPGSSYWFDMAQEAELGDRFVGWASIVAEQPVAVVATVWNPAIAGAQAYECASVTDGALLMPRQQRSFNGWNCSTQLHNVGQQPAHVSFDCYAPGGSQAGTASHVLSPNESWTFYPLPMPDGFDGACEAVSDQPLASQVLCSASSNVGSGSSASIGVSRDTLGYAAHLPRVAHGFSEGISTQFSVQNPGATQTQVTITFHDVTGDTTAVLTDVIPAHGVARYATEEVAALGGSWEGSVTITADQLIAAEVMQFQYAPLATPTPTVTNTPLPGQTVYLNFSPLQSAVAKDQIFTVDIQILAGAQQVDGAEVHINFEPLYLQVVDSGGSPASTIEAGTALDVTIHNVVDNATGQVDFAAGKLSGGLPTGTFILSTVRFRALRHTGGGSTPLTFVTRGGSPTNVTYRGSSVLASTTDGTVTIHAPTPTPTSTTTPTNTPTVPPPTPIPGKIEGLVWHDLNANGALDSGEPGLAGSSLRLYDIDHPPPEPPVRPAFVTGVDGTFQFTNVPPGWYILTAAHPAGYGPTTMNVMTVMVSSGRTTQVGFGASTAAISRIFLPIILRHKVETPAPTPTPLYCPEPANNTLEGACGPLVPNVVYREYIATQGDRDWFYFDMATAHIIEAWLTEIAADCDYDLYLRDGDGNHITSSTSQGNADEHILWGPVPAGRYYLAVADIEGWSATVPYALHVDYGRAAATPTTTSQPTATSTPTVTGTPYGCDPYEPNDHYWDAYGPLASGESYGAYLCAGDFSDWYYIDVLTLDRITVDLSVPAVADYDVYIYREGDWEQFVAKSDLAGNGTAERIEYNPPQTGRYYVRVYPYSGHSDTQPYTLRVVVGQPGPTHTPTETLVDMVYVAAGEFGMGSSGSDPDAAPDEKPQHTVYVDSFYIGRTEVTNAQYRRFIDAGGYSRREYWSDEGWQWRQANNITQPYFWDDARFNGPEQPVAGVSWYEADAYARWAGGRLPTEAEWEYAARGGPLSQGYLYAGSDDADEVAWYRDNSGGVTHAVGQKRANELGLHDMSGNVSEWCADWYDAGYYSQSPRENPKGPESGVYRVLRGGSFGGAGSASRCGFRGRTIPGHRPDYYGFRVVVAS